MEGDQIVVQNIRPRERREMDVTVYKPHKMGLGKEEGRLLGIA